MTGVCTGYSSNCPVRKASKKMGGILCLLLLNHGREIMPTYYTWILTPVSMHNFPPIIEQ
jgi:hypothetical protein